MPTYDYLCRSCGYEFEVFQKITEDHLTVCPKCDGEIERKIGGGAGLLFKGTGFYITDYKNSGSKDSKQKKETPNKDVSNSTESPKQKPKQ